MEPLSSGCGGAGKFTQVRSSNPQVATFTLTDTSTASSTIDMVTGTAGTTDLELLDDHGTVVDSVTIEVEPIAALALAATSARVVAGGSYSVKVTLADAAGRTLGGGMGRIHAAASSGVTTSQGDTFTGTVLELTTPTAGSSTVTVTAEGASSTLALQVVDLSAITAIDVGTGDYTPTYNPNNQVEVVWSTPSTAAGPAYGAKCNWQIGDPSVTLVANGAESDLGRSPFDNSQFKLAKPGRFDVVCTIGTAQLTVTLRR
ncbi:MAG TPA: hypothetical protein VF516_27145 [Kofleriaceae bacterium]